MSFRLPTQSATMTLGVFGEPGAGKTVFLTCIFHSLWMALPEHEVHFDREEVGGARYYREMERVIRDTGGTEGTVTDKVFPVRMHIDPARAEQHVSNRLSIDLSDIAGGILENLSDVKGLYDQTEQDPPEKNILRIANDTLEKADAVVVLLNSTHLDPLDPGPTGSPFSPMVTWIRQRCLDTGKPLALLFTQIDRMPRLTDEVIATIPQVQQFRTQFTNDTEKRAQGNRPFGIVRSITCYQTVPDGKKAKYQDAGNIWRREPGMVVSQLMQEAVPAIQRRIDEEQLTKRREETLANVVKKNKEKRRRGWWIMAFSIALLIAASAVIAWYLRSTAKTIRTLERVESLLDGTAIEKIDSAMEASLAQILTNRDAGDDAVRTAVRRVEAAFGRAGENLVAHPVIDATYAKRVERFRSLLPHFDAAVSNGWREKLLPPLAARGDFIRGSLELAGRPRRDRTRYLDAGAMRFASDGDHVFQTVISAYSTTVKKDEIKSWDSALNEATTVPARLTLIEGRLASTSGEDPEFMFLARKALAEHIATLLLTRSENLLLQNELLRPLVSDLAQIQSGDLRFDVLSKELLNCAMDCGHRKNTVQTVMERAIANTQASQARVENLLSTLLLDLPVAQRREIWKAIADAIAASYFFSDRVDAWPHDIEPLYVRIARWATDEKTDNTTALIAYFVGRPLYRDELEYLHDRLTALDTRRQLVSAYASILKVLAEPGTTLPDEDLLELQKELVSTVAGRETVGPLPAIGREIASALELLANVNKIRRTNREGADSAAAERLKQFLLECTRAHCGALGPNGLPEDCPNAA